jgi:hypothetical protein
MATPTGTDFNVAEYSKSLDTMSLEDLKREVLNARVKQSYGTKKYYNKEKQKAARDKKAAELKAMIARAKELGVYDEIMAQVPGAVQAKLAANGETSGVSSAS